MSTRKRVKAHQNLYKQIMNLLLRSLLVIARRARLSRAGFVLPTVAMVMLVVILLTTAILFRSFDRSKNASNVRVDQAVLNAATPALDRARAKLDALFSDPTLPRSTPSDLALYNALNSNKYNVGDETRLKLVYDIDQSGTIQSNTTTLENNETLTTAWKFPVDTDNNGLFDSYTLYGIYFRSPSRGTDGQFNRPRNVLEARMPPMSGGTLGTQCANATNTSATLIGDSSWYQSGAKLTKSFFVYITTVPITNPSPPTGYETYKGNKSFSALEFQQDRGRISLSNNAVVFQDDLELTPGSTFRLNGRVFTNANLLMGGHGGAVRIYQVSSAYSCFYKEENSKITAGGNVGTGNVADTSDQTAVTVDLFNGAQNNPGSASIDSNNRSTSSQGGNQVAYNDAAYNKRIALMKQTALSYSTTNPPTITSVSSITQYPLEVKNGFRDKINASGGSSLKAQDVLADQIELYLKNRTRRVPFAEVSAADGTGALGTYDVDGDYIDTNVFASGTIEPPAAWREPTNANTGLSLNTNKLDQTQPEQQKKDGKETYLGDRVRVGNNLPGYWKNANGNYVTGPNEKQFLGSSINWTNPNTAPRYLTTQVTPLPDLGISDRNGFWEDAAVQQASAASSNVGGLRVITGAGIYRTSSTYAALSTPSFMSAPAGLDSAGASIPNAPLLAGEATATQYNLVWSDSMPMKGGIDPATGSESTTPPDLRMRATAVYHYKDNAGTSQTPIACISSYYDPTTSTTAKNGNYSTSNNFPWGSGGTNLPFNYGSGGRSSNGVVYPAPYTTNASRFTAIATYLTELKAQAKLMFPSGRIVNEPLQQALTKINASGELADTNKPLSLSENSAVDTAICAIRILTDTSFTPSTTPVVPHGAIKEASFLDARQIKAISGTNTINYDLELEQRQPLEIRVTDLNMSQLATTTIGGTTQQEYLLPNSGIIYASRDDALLDLSDTSANSKLLSPTDFRLDSTRGPDGIRLINGSKLARINTYRAEEKGLILVSNLPVYVKADSTNNGFNLHWKPGTSTAVEEFINQLDSNWGNFYTRGDKDPASDIPDNNFACRSGQTGCAMGTNAGDQWRSATVISDAITLLSNSFTDGFRNQGDYDLNNNAGSSVTAARNKNGFWNNSFVPSALWWSTSNTDNAYPYEKSTNSYVSSYLTNGVTPIQRRVDFPEYLMEICRKIPVSQCQPGDWVVGYDANNNGNINDLGERDVKARDLPSPAVIAQLGAGTTARAALQVDDQRYARRVAFKRKSSGTLELTNWPSPNQGQVTPIPLGINSSGQVAEFPYTSSAVPAVADNALWFRTTIDTSGKPYNSPSYRSDMPLAYMGSTQLVSPPTPDIPGIPSLNLPSSNPASSYTVCTDDNNNGSTNKSFIGAISDIESGKCSRQAGNPMTQITAVHDALVDQVTFNPDSSTTDNIVRPKETYSPSGATRFQAGKTTTFTNNPPASPQPGFIVNVIDISNDFATTGDCTKIELKGDQNSIFVLRTTSTSDLKFGGSSSDCGVQVVLTGVDPNNVFWALKGNVQWVAVNSSKPHKMAGTFLTASTGNPKWNTLVFEDGGRLLGSNGTPASTNFTGSKIYAIASSGQPYLVPVLQIHSPEGSPPSDNSFPTDGNLEGEWLQRVAADTTIINAVFVSGNSPGRPSEESAGLHNFVRLLERWDNKTLNIKGSFIQYKRSAYATGPFATILSSTASATPSTTNNLSLFDYAANTYKVVNGTPTGTLPYYKGATRQWGFDVGLLSQSPDLFAQRFTQQTVTAPDEFFREVSRDEPWIQTLLCAAQGSGTNYTYAIDSSERPTSCLSLTSYND